MNAILAAAIIELGRTRSIYPNIEIQSYYQELQKKTISQFNEDSLWSCALINWIMNKIELNRYIHPTPNDWLTIGKKVNNEPQAGDIVISEIEENGSRQKLISVLVWNYTSGDTMKCLSSYQKNQVSINYISKNTILDIRRPLEETIEEPILTIDKQISISTNGYQNNLKINKSLPFLNIPTY